MSHEYLQHALALFASGRDFLVFDTETTDKMEAVHGPGSTCPVGSPTGKILQLAARRYRWNQATGQIKMVGEVNALINDPETRDCCLNPRAFDVHGIRIDRGSKLRRQGVAPAVAYTQFLKLAAGTVLVGQNVIGFDVPFVNRELARLGLHGALDARVAIDTLIIARLLFDLRSYKQRDLATFLGVQTDASRDHDALADIDTCWQLWLAMQPAVRDYQARFIAGRPDQYKRALGSVGSGWTPGR